MKKRLLSILLMCCMVLTLLPTTAFAEGGTEETLVCTCETACTAESMNTNCPACGTEGASAENCAKYAVPVNGEESGTGTSAQALTNVAITFPAPEAGENISEAMKAASGNADSGLTLYLTGPALWKQGEEPDKLDENAVYAKDNIYLLNFTFYTQKPITAETAVTFNGHPVTLYTDYAAFETAASAYDGKQDAYLGCVLFSEEGTGDPSMGDLKDLYLLSLYAFVHVPEYTVKEQFTLTPGGRYYFDLSAMDIPGTANSNLPDSTLHYVPFTYVGTVDAYSLKNEADNDTTSYEHSLFIANYNVTHTVSWNDLNTAGLLFGKDYAGGGVNYTLRAPSAGFHYSYDQNVGGTPRNNEWDVILDKAKQGNNDNTNGYVKNWQDIYSWGQDKSSASSPSGRSLRGYQSSRHWYTESATRADATFGFRPVLELPTDLAADSLKAVELVTKGRMPGETYNSINIIVKKGESFKAPSAEGLPLSAGISADTPMWWVDENLNFYKPGDTVPADVSALTAFYGGFGLFLDRGNGAVEVTPDNYTDIFGDGTASFVLPKGKSVSSLGDYYNLTSKDILEIYSTGRLEKYGCVFPNLKLKNADLTSVRLSEEYIGQGRPLFITPDGKNTVGSLNGIIESCNTLCVIGDGSLTLNSALTLGQYTQYGGVSVTMAGGLNVYNISVDSGSLTVTGDTQAITFRNQSLSDLYMGDGVRLFLGSSAQDAAEADVPELSAEMQKVYQRYLSEDSTLTSEEYTALFNALREQFNAIFQQLPGKTYVRITGAWDVTYQPGENGTGNTLTDIKFYNDILTLRGKLFTRTGYTQTGWATVDGGEKVYAFGGGYDENQALTLYPVWTRNSSGGSSSSYPITVPGKAENGSVTVSPKNASAGSTVTITVKPDSGYVLETITAADKNGNDLKLTDKGNGKYTFTMPASKVEVKATFLEDNSVLNFFYDVPNDAYYYEAVKWAVENGITRGTDDTHFSPDGICTRAQAVTFLWRAAGSPEPETRTMPFTDVPAGSYYYDAVLWAVENGITKGTSDTMFSPDATCSRAQIVTFLWRSEKSPAAGSRNPFADVKSSAYYADAVLWAVKEDITKGTTNTTFSPDADCTRAQIVTFLWRCKK